MNFRLIYEDENGYCKIIVPSASFQQPKESDEAAIGRLYAIAIPGVVEFFVCVDERLPQDLTFRDAWRKGTVSEPIKIDFQKALEMHRSRLKEACEKKIKQLNEQLERALENDNLPEQVAIRGTKKILRSIHEMNLTHCKTIEDIKYSIPRELHDIWSYYDPIPPKNNFHQSQCRNL